MVRAAVLAILLVLGAAAPGTEARPACGKRLACKGKARAARAGVPVAWAKRSPLPGRGALPGDPAPDPGAPGPRPGAPPPPPPPPPPPDNPRYLQVVARDDDPEHLALQPSRGTLLSGNVEVEFNNRFAEDPHDLRLRLGSTTYTFGELSQGEAATRRLDLRAGSWKLWCGIGDHEDRGMVAHVTVGDG